MPGEDWQKAKAAWTETNWPHKRNIPRPRRKSTEMPRWKKDVIWGQYWKEPNDDPTQQDHYPTTSFDTTYVDPEDWW